MEELKKIKNFADLKSEYDLSSEDKTINSIIHKIMDRTEFYNKILLDVLQPEDFNAMHECINFTEVEKTKIFELYKELMILNRELLKVLIKNLESEKISAIEESDKKLRNIKPEILNIIEKLQKSWSSSSKKTSVGYFG